MNARRPVTSQMRASGAAKLAEAAPIFAALGDTTRLQIVQRLCGEGPTSIVRLAEGASVSRQAVTKHLQVLEAAGLARRSRAGRECICELRTSRLFAVTQYLDQISRDWDAALERLRAFVENEKQ